MRIHLKSLAEQPTAAVAISVSANCNERDQSYKTILFVTKGCAHWDDMTTLKVFAPNNRKENFQMNDLEKEQIKPKTRTKKERIESRNQ